VRSGIAAGVWWLLGAMLLAGAGLCWSLRGAFASSGAARDEGGSR
jgi:hypothetical protein